VRGRRDLALDGLCGAIGAARAGAVTDEALARATRALWDTQLLDDVVVERDDHARPAVVTFTVRPRPTLASIAFEGLPEDETRALERAMPVRPTRVDAEDLRVLRVALRDRLVREGYASAKVDGALEPAGEGQVNARLVVTRGPRAAIDRVEIPGLTSLLRSDALVIMQLDPSYPRGVGSVYQPDNFEAARLRLGAALYDRGLLEAKIEPETVRLSEDGTRQSVEVRVTEGAVHTEGTLTVRGGTAADAAKVKALVPWKRGAVFARASVLQGMVAARAYAESRGLRLEGPESNVDAKKHVVDLLVTLAK
jgi:outer membrane protein insertion porin family